MFSASSSSSSHNHRSHIAFQQGPLGEAVCSNIRSSSSASRTQQAAVDIDTGVSEISASSLPHTRHIQVTGFFPSTQPQIIQGTMINMFLSTIKLFSFLINYEFWSRLGFFVGYILTFLLVLEVARLASTDAHRKQVEKILDSYAASKPQPEPRRPLLEPKLKRVSLDELEDMERRSMTVEKEKRVRTPSPAVSRAPEIEPTQQDEEKRRRRAASTSVSTKPMPASRSASQSRPQAQSSSPTRRLRKRSDTLNSSNSAEPKDAVRRKRREVSPAESKSSSRHVSPTPKSRSKETRILGGSLGKMLRSRG